MTIKPKGMKNGTGNGKPRAARNQGQPRAGQFVGNIAKNQMTPWSNNVTLDNRTFKKISPNIEPLGRTIV